MLADWYYSPGDPSVNSKPNFCLKGENVPVSHEMDKEQASNYTCRIMHSLTTKSTEPLAGQKEWDKESIE